MMRMMHLVKKSWAGVLDLEPKYVHNFPVYKVLDQQGNFFW